MPRYFVTSAFEFISFRIPAIDNNRFGPPFPQSSPPIHLQRIKKNVGRTSIEFSLRTAVVTAGIVDRETFSNSYAFVALQSRYLNCYGGIVGTGALCYLRLEYVTVYDARNGRFTTNAKKPLFSGEVLIVVRECGKLRCVIEEPFIRARSLNRGNCHNE